MKTNKPAKQILVDAGLENSHWGHRIITAEETNGFTSSDNDDSDSWVTCACGKATPNIPRDGNIPLDTKLQHLGNYFSNDVYYNNFKEAATTLVAIEERALVVAKANIVGEVLDET